MTFDTVRYIFFPFEILSFFDTWNTYLFSTHITPLLFILLSCCCMLSIAAYYYDRCSDLKQHIYYLSHSLYGSSISAQLSWVVCFKVSKGSVKVLAGSVVSAETGPERNRLPSSQGSWQNSIPCRVRNWQPPGLPQYEHFLKTRQGGSLLANGEFQSYVTILQNIIT